MASRTRRFSRGSIAAGTLLFFAAACSSGSSGGGGSITLQSLSGNVRAAGGAGLPGVTVSVGNATTTSNANGDFILASVGSLSSGTATVTFDGSTAAGGTYPTLDIFVPLPSGTTQLVMPQVITLPDLASTSSASQTVSLNADGSTTAPIVVGGAVPDLSLSAPAGTVVTIDGMVGTAAMADINATPVIPSEVPMPLDSGLRGVSFVTIQPGNATFDQPGALVGLDASFPNDLDLPVGTTVDIWSFDHDDEAWVNRSDETGQVGVVVDLGGGMSEIQASGVITEGGWHAPAIPVATNCATTIFGFVEDLSNSEPIPGASIALSTGQFATTDAMGMFTIEEVPAYDPADFANNGTCTAVDVGYEVILPPAYGSISSGALTIGSLAITPGGITNVQASLTVPATGSIAGLLNGDPAMTGQEVTVESDPSGGFSTTVVPDEGGAFFLTGVPAGDYIASYLFDGQATPTEFSVTVTANTISTLALQFAQGMGARDVTVTVFEDDDNDNTTLVPLAGAQVVLQGSDEGSQYGLIMTTDQNGEATFEDVDGPYTVTAAKDYEEDAEVVRFATTVVDVTPADDTIGVPIFVDVDDSLASDATLNATVSNLPMLQVNETLTLFVYATDVDDDFRAEAPIDLQTGNASLDVPSGIELDAMVLLRDANGGPQSSLLAPDVAPIDQGDSGQLDLDYSTAGVSWNQQVTGTFSNVDPGVTSIELEICFVDRVNGRGFAVDLYDGPSGQISLQLPDVTDAGLAGYDAYLIAEAEGDDVEQGCTKLLATTPNSLTFRFLDAGTPIAPLDGASYELDDLLELTIAFDEASNGGLGTNGVNLYHFEAEDGLAPTGIDQSEWTIFVASGTEMFTMPVVPLELFGEGQNIEAGFEQFRLAGFTFGFDAFFDADLPLNFDELIEMRTSSYGTEFTVDITTVSPF